VCRFPVAFLIDESHDTNVLLLTALFRGSSIEIKNKRSGFLLGTPGDTCSAFYNGRKPDPRRQSPPPDWASPAKKINPPAVPKRVVTLINKSLALRLIAKLQQSQNQTGSMAISDCLCVLPNVHRQVRE